MKKEEGITLMSLIIYITILLIVVTMLATISTMFFKNTNIIEDDTQYSGEFNKFNMYFVEDVKKNSSTYTVNSNEVVFLDGTTYRYEDGAIYRDKVKICTNITKCIFTKRIDNATGTNKEIINVQIGINENNNFETSNDYVLKYW